MRLGFTASVIAHSTVLLAGLWSLQGAEPFDPSQAEAIPIELVPIEELTQIRQGSLESDVIETEAPSTVETEEPAQLAQRTGNTEEDQPTPEETDIETPAPTTNTAPEVQPEPNPVPDPVTEPEPVPEPEPTPEPEPEPAPEPEPEPEPVREILPRPEEPEPAPEPEPAAEPEPELTAETNDPEPQEVSPVVPRATSQVDAARKRFAEAKQAEEAERRRLAEQQQREADEVSDIINNEASRGATTGEGGSQTAGRSDGQAARLTQNEMAALARQMRRCFIVTASMVDRPDLSVKLRISMNFDGTVNGVPQVVSPLNDPLDPALAIAAQQAVLRCGPYRLSPESYDQWSVIESTFRPAEGQIEG
jgi:outer membrane biosynthesis protein TonB